MPVIRPRLVHRDLHLGNVIVSDERFAALVDFEMVREWDRAYDFNKLDDLFVRYDDGRAPFLSGYQEVAGELPASFGLRRWVYAGVGYLLAIADYLDGNQAYADMPRRLEAWMDLPSPPGTAI